MKNLVDWNKAPEGATHYNAECACPWLKETPPSYYYEDTEDWIKYAPEYLGHSEEHFNNAVKRPQEWDGSGVPPVGTECEYRLDGGKWFKCKITYRLSGNDDCFVAWCDHLAREQFLRFTAVPYKLYLRKILKTPEQIAAEERLQAVDEMLDFVVLGITYKDLLSALYDAGYRRSAGETIQEPEGETYPRYSVGVKEV